MKKIGPFFKRSLFFLLPWVFFNILNLFFFKLQQLELISLIFWYYLVTFTGNLFFPVMAATFPKALDAGYGLSKALGILLATYLNWIFVNLNLLSFNPFGLLSCLLLLFLFVQKTVGAKVSLQVLVSENKKHIIIVEMLFFVIFALFLSLAAFHPEIYGGEKPMDFSILNTLVQTNSLPLKDPWLAGELLKYYYFGYYIFAGLIKQSGISLEVGYLISLATIPALLSGALYSLFLALLKNKRYAVMATLTLSLGANLKSYIAGHLSDQAINFSFFWSSTRVFANNYFAEYPSWSFLFQDLHPHVMAYPFTAVLIYFIYDFFCNNKRPTILFIFLFALVWGSLLAINTWDFIFYSLLIALIAIYNIFFNKKFSKLKVVLLPITGVVAVVMYLPMFLILNSGKEKVFYFFKGTGNNLISQINFFGIWWAITLLLVITLIALKGKRAFSTLKQHLFWSSLFFSTLVLHLLIENIVFMDRMNTIFKGYTNLWILYGVIALMGIRYLHFFTKEKKFYPILVIFIFLLCAPFAGSLFNIKGALSLPPAGAVRPTLKGNEYLRKHRSGDYVIIQWIQKNIKGLPTLIERYGNSFNNQAARISTNTGVPSYLGWINHLRVRGAKLGLITKRKMEIDFIYNSSDAFKVFELMQKRKINLIVVGSFERMHYSTQGLEKFKKYHNLFIPLVQGKQTVLYGVGNYKSFIKDNSEVK